MNNIKERIQKVLNLAERAGTPAEAQNAMMRAREMMAKYNIDSAELQKSNPEEVITRRTDIIVKNHVWGIIFQEVAQSLRCKIALRTINRTDYVSIWGFSCDVEVTEAIITSVIKVMEKERRRQNKIIKSQGLCPKGVRNDVSKGFYEGFKEQVRNFDSIHEQFALVLHVPQKVSEVFTNDTDIVQTKVKNHAVKNTSAFYAGKDLGSSFNRGIE